MLSIKNSEIAIFTFWLSKNKNDELGKVKRAQKHDQNFLESMFQNNVHETVVKLVSLGRNNKISIHDNGQDISGNSKSKFPPKSENIWN